MNALPVIVRELRGEARNPLNYWLRVLGTAVMLFMAAVVVVNLDGRIAGRGKEMFGVLQPTLFSLIWLLAPIITCDCISRERREGTLGLLFLTPLRPMDVGAAKALSGILRAFTIVLAVMPIVAVPLLLGGVSGRDLLRATMMNAMSLLGAITAGILASSRCREFSRAALLSLLLAAIALVVLGALQTVPFIVSVMHGAFGGPGQMPAWGPLIILTFGPWMIGSGAGNTWHNSPWSTSPTTLWLSLGQVLAAIALLVVTLLYLNRNLRRLSVETGMSQRQVWWWQTFCTPRLFKRTFVRINRGLLNRNPIGWLQRRTWTARVATWGWLGFLVAVETFLVTFDNRRFDSNWNDMMDAQPVIAAFIAIGLAFSAADSFRKERETGALELLLVTPLSARQVIMGRLFGLWGQYLPVFVLLISTWWYTASPASWQVWGSADDLFTLREGFAVIYTSTFLLLPVIGLLHSLRSGHFLVAWLTTIVQGMVLPYFLPVAVILAWELHTPVVFQGSIFLEYAFVVVFLQTLFAIRAARNVHRNLAERRFALGN